ncbi:hypothetical protein BT67DRAFT_283509 [Trichocladium antarcticum]|uniref:Uncharacterized protein n=1 Tax=Trichocladium antarcticum TaxID=1450529 RepID=A0AAN6ZEG2_9PEZI|nr:hypothetical protein BT67DRAFT_283509 [Trichocladium antarcticum]
MSWPGGDWTPSDNGGGGDSYGRPVNVASLGTFGKKGVLVKQTPEQADLALHLLSSPFETLPQLPVWAFLAGFTTRWHKAWVATTLADMSGKLGRVLTPEEADALAHHRSIGCRRHSYSAPVILATAAYFARRGRNRFRFPFFTPTNISPIHFPSPRMALLRGRPAIASWHALRFGAYWSLSWLFLAGAIGGWADTSYMVMVIRDPKCKAMLDVAVQATREAQRKRLEGTAGLQQPPHPETAAPGSDDASPSRPYPAPAYESAAGAFQGERAQQQQQQQQVAPEQSPRGSSKEDDAFLFDDASPVAPAPSQRPQSPTPAPPTGSGSAWERLRQQAKQGGEGGWNQGEEQSRQTRAQQRAEQQYTYSPDEQEKAYVKELAQKEFDAMLERERRGMGDSGGGKS